MANPEHLAKLKEGAEAWNRWRKQCLTETPDFCHANLRGAGLWRANLRGANLVEADLGNVNLCQANLRGANLGRANFSGANLSEANLCHAYLGYAKLDGANLNDANFGGANLCGASLMESILIWANLSSANLPFANLEGASAGYTVFADVDLSCTIGLGTMKHSGPSTIGVDTIYKSKGDIPLAFLRGCGVSEFFIENMAGLVGKGIEFYSLFISYSTKDQDFADRLYVDLQAKGVRCWFAPHDLLPGRKIHEEIEGAIRIYDKLLLVLSEHSMVSGWVQGEIFRAREKGLRDKRPVLFPISLCSFDALRAWKLIDGDTGKDLARDIREYLIPDFSQWKTDHDAYKRSFDKLLKGLQGKPDHDAQGRRISNSQ
jgi:hypothetical protein